MAGGWRARAALGISTLAPAYFGMVMATGIVSLGAQYFGLPVLAAALFHLNLVLYVVLWVLNGVRICRYRRAFLIDLTDHLRGPGFFTVVAGTSILASQAIVVKGDFQFARVLWLLALILWVGLTYTIFAALTVKSDKPTLDRGINGGWLLAVVATQSLAVLSAMLATQSNLPYKLELNFFALSMWLWGGMLYIWMMSLIFYRYTFFKFSPSDLAPPYWINMGAMAISTLAGSLLINNAPNAPYLTSLLPFLKGFTILYWATGSWWIPMLVVLGVWRHVFRRFPLRYDPLYWGAVFPLGMYAACTYQMDIAMEFEFLTFVARTFFVAALIAWSAAFGGLIHQFLKGGAATQSKARP